MRYVLAMALVLLAAPTANASYIDVARAQWPGSPCAGREIVTIEPLVGVDGLAWKEECRVAIRAGMSEYDTCLVLVHEIGHLAGQEHGEGVMRPSVRGYFHYGCYRAVPRTHITFAAAKEAIYWLTLGEPIHCRRSGYGAVCRAGTARWRISIDPYLGTLKTRLRDAPEARSR